MKRYATVVNIARDEDGGYVATAPALPSCISQGETIKQAQENLAEAISMYLEYLLEQGKMLPPGLAADPHIAVVSVQGKGADVKVSAVPAWQPA